MGLIKVVEGGHWDSGIKTKVVEVESPISDEFVLIRLKTMAEILFEYDAWFDKYGNLVTKHGHLSPVYFGHLGQEFSVKAGCGFTMVESDWLKVK